MNKNKIEFNKITFNYNKDTEMLQIYFGYYRAMMVSKELLIDTFIPSNIEILHNSNPS